MKKWILMISLVLNAALLILLVVVASSFRTELYSFSGKNEHMAIEGGQIVKNRSFEQVTYRTFTYSGEIPENAYGFKIKLYFADGNNEVSVYHFGAEFNLNPGSVLDRNDIMLNSQDICYKAYGDLERQLKRLSKKEIIHNLYFEIEFNIEGGDHVIETLRLDVTPAGH